MTATALLIGAMVALAVGILALVAARDMDRRGRHGEIYAIAILFLLPVGLVMWGLDRRRPAAAGGDPEGGAGA